MIKQLSKEKSKKKMNKRKSRLKPGRPSLDTDKKISYQPQQYNQDLETIEQLEGEPEPPN